MTNTLLDITHLIVPEVNISFFDEEEHIELYQMCLFLMDEFINENPTIITEPEFEEFFDEDINELVHSHFDLDIFYNDDAEEEIDDIIEQAKCDFFDYFLFPRSFNETIILQEPNMVFIDRQINILRNKPQPKQRTKEWYIFRYNLITASNAYKAFENQNVKNQLIYEKCQPLNNNNNNNEITMVNVNTSLHWGQKYEPLSVIIYEHLYNTKIEDFGCIQHDTYSFLGASPDGINVDKKSTRYGRMLEIKNIVNREINGIPKKEYWIQMQLQMEVCDLDECDFLETKFTEYTNYLSYLFDTSDELYEDEDGLEFQNTCVSKDNQIKGIIIYFHTAEGHPFYLYKPLDIIHPKEIEEWQEKNIDYYHKPEYKYVFMKTIYWKLDIISCVLVCRNKQWFKDNISLLQDIWTIIEKERISGFEHRAPNRKQKKELVETTPTTTSKCLLQFNNKINVIKKDVDNTVYIPIPDLSNIDIHFN
jgi:putative phage-type endonuclease